MASKNFEVAERGSKRRYLYWASITVAVVGSSGHESGQSSERQSTGSTRIARCMLKMKANVKEWRTTDEDSGVKQNARASVKITTKSVLTTWLRRSWPNDLVHVRPIPLIRPKRPTGRISAWRVEVVDFHGEKGGFDDVVNNNAISIVLAVLTVFSLHLLGVCKHRRSSETG